MGINIQPLGSAPTSAPSETAAPTVTPQEKTESPSVASGVASAQPATGGLLTGKAAHQAMEFAQQQQQENSKGRVFDFYLKAGEEKRVLFLNGALDSEGYPQLILAHEHNIPGPGNNWKEARKFLCTTQFDPGEPCPLCQTEHGSYLAAYFTVIDFTQYTKKDGTTGGFTKKLFTAKPTTYGQLHKQMQKRDGSIVGALYDISRTNNKVANVGDQFDFKEKNSIEQWIQAFVDNGICESAEAAQELLTPIDITEVRPQYTAAELRSMGFGNAPAVSTAAAAASAPASPEALAKGLS